jgi:hypothetical protein
MLASFWRQIANPDAGMFVGLTKPVLNSSDRFPDLLPFRFTEVAELGEQIVVDLSIPGSLRWSR